MFQTILIGYDEPERGGEAITLAETLRDPQTGTLVLTSVYPPAPLPVGGFVAPQDIEMLRDQTEELLLVARDALPDRDRVMIRAIPSDSAARVLTEIAEVEHADLIVVGSSRRSALGRLLPGTTAERLLQDAPARSPWRRADTAAVTFAASASPTTGRPRPKPRCTRRSRSRSSSALP